MIISFDALKGKKLIEWQALRLPQTQNPINEVGKNLANKNPHAAAAPRRRR